MIETDGARTVLDALASGDEDDIERAVDAAAYHRDFYETHLSVDRSTFRALLAAPGETPDDDVLAHLADGFESAADRVEDLRANLAALEAVDTAAVERDVRRHLPGDPPLAATVHAVVDGFNGGFQHDGDVAMSLLRPPETYPTGLRHELHHVGAREVRGDDPFGDLMTATTPDRDAVDLVGTIVAEGLAVEFAQGGLSVYERRDEATADRIADYRARESAAVREVFETVETVAQTDDADERSDHVRSVVTDPGGVLPPTHFVGARVARAIETTLGHDRLVETVADFRAFLSAYRRAGAETDLPVPSLEATTTAVERVERERRD